jgi:hypothetical protein
MMKAVSIIGVVLLLAVNIVAPLPAAIMLRPYQSDATIVLGIIVLAAILARRSPAPKSGGAAVEAARPMPSAAPAPQAEAEIVSFLALLQEKGRLIDFLMDDVNGYDDAQVGAAARVVHAGCKAALQEHFQIHPLRPESEGSIVQVAAGYAADEYRLLGRISGQAPFSGVLVHRGWRTDLVKLPRILGGSADRLPTIAPAEVELK